MPGHGSACPCGFNQPTLAPARPSPCRGACLPGQPPSHRPKPRLTPTAEPRAWTGEELGRGAKVMPGGGLGKAVARAPVKAEKIHRKVETLGT